MNETQNPRSAVPSPKSWQLHFEVPIAPCGKARARATKNRHYTPLETKAAQRIIANVARREMRIKNMGPMWEGPVALTIFAWFKTDEKEKHYTSADCKPDWDNIGKLVSDALTGVAWKDDCQVSRGMVEKYFGPKDEICVRVRGAWGDYAGVLP